MVCARHIPRALADPSAAVKRIGSTAEPCKFSAWTFAGVLPGWTVFAGLLACALSYIGFALSLCLPNERQSSRRIVKLFAGVQALICLVFWGVSLYVAARTRHDGLAAVLRFVWLPCGPFIAVLVIRALRVMAQTSRQDVLALKSQMYNHKRA